MIESKRNKEKKRKNSAMEERKYEKPKP